MLEHEPNKNKLAFRDLFYDIEVLCLLAFILILSCLALFSVMYKTESDPKVAIEHSQQKGV